MDVRVVVPPPFYLICKCRTVQHRTPFLVLFNPSTAWQILCMYSKTLPWKARHVYHRFVESFTNHEVFMHAIFWMPLCCFNFILIFVLLRMRWEVSCVLLMALLHHQAKAEAEALDIVQVSYTLSMFWKGLFIRYSCFEKVYIYTIHVLKMSSYMLSMF